jgi:hypothetical protein
MERLDFDHVFSALGRAREVAPPTERHWVGRDLFLLRRAGRRHAYGVAIARVSVNPKRFLPTQTGGGHRSVAVDFDGRIKGRPSLDSRAGAAGADDPSSPPRKIDNLKPETRSWCPRPVSQRRSARSDPKGPLARNVTSERSRMTVGRGSPRTASQQDWSCPSVSYTNWPQSETRRVSLVRSIRCSKVVLAVNWVIVAPLCKSR